MTAHKPVIQSDAQETDRCVYIDTVDHLAHYMFDDEHVDLTVIHEYEITGTLYLLVFCSFPRAQTRNFLRAAGTLPPFMESMGYEDYTEVRAEFMDGMIRRTDVPVEKMHQRNK